MTAAEHRIERAAVALRDAFDRTFAEAPTAATERALPFLALRIGGEPFAVRVGEIASLASAGKVVPFPTPMPELLGLSTVRGNIVPIYSLAKLLGRRVAAGPPRWLLMYGTADVIGLAFDELESYLDVPPGEVYATAVGDAAWRYAEGTVRFRNEARTVLGLASIVATIRERVEVSFADKERR